LLGVGFKNIVIALDSGEFESSNRLYKKLFQVGLIPWIWLRPAGEEDLDTIPRNEIHSRIDTLLSSDKSLIRDELLVGKVNSLLKGRRYGN